MNTDTSNSHSLKSAWLKVVQFAGYAAVENQYMELIAETHKDNKRGNRLCVCVSDIHLTDGTVGFQNLGKFIWDSFYDSLVERCKTYYINEVLFVLDGDIVDMIRSGRWAEKGIYPWERDREQEFSDVVNLIIKDIVENKHRDFFASLSSLADRLERDVAGIVKDKVKIVITIGNHDKELFCDQKALSYFYEQGLGIKIQDISLQERQAIGRMYGNETMFDDRSVAPYLPFYYGDTGFRFFTTHGQWRDKANSREVDPKKDSTGWSVADGWSIEKWKKLHYSPFFLPCFGDSVAAGVLSTFIYKVKDQLEKEGYKNKRLNCILDELDLYRPTYTALTRILVEADRMRGENKQAQSNQVLETTRLKQKNAIHIIEDTLYRCIIEWLSWDFTYQTSPVIRRIGFRIVKKMLVLLQKIGYGLEITAIAWLMKFLALIDRHHNKGVNLREMRKFPAFLPEYLHYGFQIHGEGHTHIPLQEQPDIGGKHPSTYINFGTWRDQILPRKDQGYRRQGVLRSLYILDLENKSKKVTEPERAFDYFVEDIVHWSDFKDKMDQSGKAEPKI
ncbi:hypothetical protein AU255_07430 [Methyloprofundus sedimenti]|uniref:Uncharacterized protein n=1 Tax=Methyloprofundus sedimenti TaxID=1420851 RepID=A0A1V8M844_9GAMM|nr:metallophosphoesterase [Methyloprofundus sedimenti]OQK17688.1 hypothetical protein AU255_07430 [Methyloprofundus sedimenti]